MDNNSNADSTDWKNHPGLNGIPREKLNMLTGILTQAETMKSDALIPFFLKSATEAGKKGISFSDSETDLILNVLKSRMSKQDIQKIDTIRKLSQMIAKKQANS